MNEKLEKIVVELYELIKSRFYGKYRGIVTSIDDSENLGRIMANVPEIYGEEESPWAFPSSLFAGMNYGFVMLPKVGDGVWIEFEAGDISRPIWSSFWWASDEFPEQAGENVRLLITPNNHKIVLDDQNNEIHLLHSSGSELKLKENEIVLKAGSSEIVISSNGVDINNGALVIR
jgi:uncharacterized protein involved in type VI secretion and phage assembly